MTRACAYCGALVTDRSDGRRVDADTGEPHQHSTASPLPPREGETEAAPDTSVGESEAAADAPAKGDGADFAANDEKVRALLDGAEPPIPSATSPPTTGGLVGGEVMEATGDELIAFAEHARELPMLPLLGQEKYIVEGWSHLLAGYPRSGKTELLFRAIREWLDEGRSVVYLTEEPRSIWEQRLRRRSGDWSNLHVAFALGTPPEVLFRRAFEGEEEIVIVDTLRNLLNLRDETDNSEVARVLNPWVAGARRAEKTLIMAHHMRKGGGKRGEGISGGHALLGVFDIALELGWDDHHAARRTIKGHARLIETPEMVYERAEDGTFRALGDPEQLRLSEVQDRVKAALSEEWTKTSEVRENLDDPRPGDEQTRKALVALARDGDAERDPPIVEDARGKTVKWRNKPHLPRTSLKLGGEVYDDRRKVKI